MLIRPLESSMIEARIKPACFFFIPCCYRDKILERKNIWFKRTVLWWKHDRIQRTLRCAHLWHPELSCKNCKFYPPILGYIYTQNLLRQENTMKEAKASLPVIDPALIYCPNDGARSTTISCFPVAFFGLEFIHLLPHQSDHQIPW